MPDTVLVLATSEPIFFSLFFYLFNIFPGGSQVIPKQKLSVIPKQKLCDRLGVGAQTREALMQEWPYCVCVSPAQREVMGSMH